MPFECPLLSEVFRDLPVAPGKPCVPAESCPLCPLLTGL